MYRMQISSINCIIIIRPIYGGSLCVNYGTCVYFLVVLIVFPCHINIMLGLNIFLINDWENAQSHILIVKVLRRLIQQLLS